MGATLSALGTFTTGGYTLFAPSTAGLLATFDAVDLAVEVAVTLDLNDVLAYHVVPNLVLSTDLPGLLPNVGDSVDVATLQGETIAIARTDTGYTVNGIAISAVDDRAFNGVVHTIEGLLTPSTFSVPAGGAASADSVTFMA